MTSFNHINIAGEVFSHSQIGDVAKEKLQLKLSEWEREFYVFVSEWLTEKDFIEVQTSGSTGEAKLIQLPKLVMQKSAERTVQYFNLKKSNNLLLNLSCKYIAAKMMVVRALEGEMNLMVVDPSSDFDFLENEKFHFGAMVPLQVQNILQSENGKSKLANIENLLIGGSSIPFSLEKEIESFDSNIVSTYGMTETATHIAVRHLSGEMKADFYKTLPGISIRKNEKDCLEIFPEEQQNWLQTTDMVELISDNEFKILGRSDYVIISGGIKFNPEQIEKKLAPFINFPFIISSKPDEKLGQKLVLIVETEESDSLTNEILETCKKSLDKFEQPREIIFGKLPRTDNGKVIRN